MNKIKEIITAWINAISPTQEQKELAEQRLEVCEGCPYMVKGTITSYICKLCGCPIHKKIFSPTNSCPLKKWQN